MRRTNGGADIFRQPFTKGAKKNMEGPVGHGSPTPGGQPRRPGGLQHSGSSNSSGNTSNNTSTSNSGEEENRTASFSNESVGSREARRGGDFSRSTGSISTPRTSGSDGSGSTTPPDSYKDREGRGSGKKGDVADTAGGNGTAGGAGGTRTMSSMEAPRTPTAPPVKLEMPSVIKTGKTPLQRDRQRRKERQRRRDILDTLEVLRHHVPINSAERVTRTVLLQRTIEYIGYLEQRVKLLEAAPMTGGMAAPIVPPLAASMVPQLGPGGVSSPFPTIDLTSGVVMSGLSGTPSSSNESMPMAMASSSSTGNPSSSMPISGSGSGSPLVGLNSAMPGYPHGMPVPGGFPQGSQSSAAGGWPSQAWNPSMHVQHQPQHQQHVPAQQAQMQQAQQMQQLHQLQQMQQMQQMQQLQQAQQAQQAQQMHQLQQLKNQAQMLQAQHQASQQAAQQQASGNTPSTNTNGKRIGETISGEPRASKRHHGIASTTPHL